MVHRSTHRLRTGERFLGTLKHELMKLTHSMPYRNTHRPRAGKQFLITLKTYEVNPFYGT